MTKQTSIEAYHKLRHTGKLGELQRRTYTALRGMGPSTNREVAEYMGVIPNAISGRMNELEKLQAVRRNGTRKCMVSGHRSILWEALG